MNTLNQISYVEWIFLGGYPEVFAGTCPTIETSVRLGGKGAAEQGRVEPSGGEQQEGVGRVERGRSEEENQLGIQPIPA